MYVKQISVFVENSFGSAAETLDVLTKENININALSIADTSDYGIMRLIVDAPEKARDLLREHGATVKITDVLALPISNQPGGLSAVLSILTKAHISIDYMYAFPADSKESAIVITKTGDLEKTVAVLIENGITPLEDTEL